MDTWQEATIQSVLCARNEDELLLALLQASSQLGFEYCAYGIRVPLPISQPRVHMLNNYPKDWRQQYTRQNYLACDPTVAHALSSIEPLIWSDKIFASCKPFWEESRAHGLQFGWAQPCHKINGASGLLTLARSHDNISPEELRDHSMKMYWLAQLAHEGMSQFLVPKLMPEALVVLSWREIEVLRWTAEGKTSWEVSEIMNISSRTVNFHANNAMEKLGTNNKTAAAIKAAILGLL